MSNGEAVSWLTPEKVTIYVVLIAIIFLLYKGWVVTKKQNEADKALLREAHAKEISAYEKVITYKDEQIKDLKVQVLDTNKVLGRREKQLHLVLNEIAPSMVAWSNSMQTVAMEVIDGGRGGVDLPA